MGQRRWWAVLLIAAVAWVSHPAPVSAQPLGQFNWQLEPFCNSVVVNVVQNGSAYTLDGYDTQCTGPRAPLVGVATPNADGTIGFGLQIVTVPSGRGLQVAATIDLATLGGAWSDSAGNTGTLVFRGNSGGVVRPAPPSAFGWGATIVEPSTAPPSFYGLAVQSRPGGGATGVATVLAVRGDVPTGPASPAAAISGRSRTDAGVVGVSELSVGVAGVSSAGSGVVGQSQEGAGVRAFSSSGKTALELQNGALRVSGTVRPAFTHTTTASNVFGSGTRVDHPLTNGDPDAMIFITHVYVDAVAPVYWPHAMSVWYNAAFAKWEIYADNATPLPVNLRFNVFVIKR